jgi:hypothetical protein
MSASSAIDSEPDSPVNAQKAQMTFKRRRKTWRVTDPDRAAILVMTSNTATVKKESAAIPTEMTDAMA